MAVGPQCVWERGERGRREEDTTKIEAGGGGGCRERVGGGEGSVMIQGRVGRGGQETAADADGGGSLRRTLEGESHKSSLTANWERQ